ncbi:hypothetical protein F2Q68_00041933 [Brassica cretica]|uniref:Chaperone DnaJ C-terminal domain-containing protein n=1 Tax=Brassica cretica TaxID=69181 RepID=A0A8S9MDC4_BRACR|nr:hypothetical protein F2Q68_00041933 [Brassica cretica]
MEARYDRRKARVPLMSARGSEIHCTCKSAFLGRVKNLQVDQWKFLENFLVYPATGIYRPTRHLYKMSITANSIVTSSTLTICEVEALVGFEKSFKHLDEHEVDISSKGITKPKEVKKFKGEGMPLHYSTKKGSLFVTFEVLFPSSLTEDQKKKIKEVLA